MEEGADPCAWDEEGLTPLHYSASHDHFEVSQLLLENGADPNAEDEEGHTALDMARLSQNIFASMGQSAASCIARILRYDQIVSCTLFSTQHRRAPKPLGQASQLCGCN